ncbi:MAG: UDP-N-acetylmuramoylalanine--D-glutamate ligase [Myxococcota bacterium]|jgi:UDP-N-acetylmuramoylalanine--D-glutamate ligase
MPSSLVSVSESNAATSRSYSVIGLAKSGVAAANALHRRGHSVIASDPGTLEKLADHLARIQDGVQVKLGANVMRDGDIVVVSPGVPPCAPIFAEARERGLEVIGEIALFQRLQPNSPVLAVTGTDGKSTTTAWLGAICAGDGPAWVGGNIGIPLCEAVDQLTSAHLVIAEVSCFQLTTAAEFHPRVAIFTNLAPDHLNYYSGSVEEYYGAKKRLLANLGPDETAVLNYDDPVLRTWSAPGEARTLWYSRQPLPYGLDGAYVRDQAMYERNDGVQQRIMQLSDLPLPGVHNVENALAAALGARAWGISMTSVQDGLLTFGGLEHRIERVGVVDDVTWYNDSKATNPHAAQAALRAFSDQPHKMVLLCGGSEKDADFGPWADLASEHCAHVICFGQTGPQLAAALGKRVPVTEVADMTAAIRVARKVAPRGGTVVLSPACASFDQFDNFEHRGDVFKSLVNALTGC